MTDKAQPAVWVDPALRCNECPDLRKEIERLTAELAALRREGQDAARYKWLRDNGAAIDPDSLHWKRNKWLDAAIDAALAAAPEDGQKSGG
jgi:hypothetical protein